MCAIFTQYYTPNNATIAIAGDFDAAKIKGAAGEIFRAHSAAGPKVDPVDRRDPADHRAKAR